MKLLHSISAPHILMLALSLAKEIAMSPIRRTFLPTAEDFFVNGSHIPGIPFRVNGSYAGLLPVSLKDRVQRSLFFWWYPAYGESSSKDDLVIWFNGGPGCSSLEGLLQENGPWILPKDSAGPTENPFSWHLISNVLYVEQPISTGFSVGKTDIRNEAGVAVEFYGFLVQFLNTFPKLKGNRLWLAGESYAGLFITYIADYLLLKQHTDSIEHGINYQGFSMYDPVLYQDYISFGTSATEYAEAHKDELMLDDLFIEQLNNDAQKASVYKFVQRNLVYPSTGPIQVPPGLKLLSWDPATNKSEFDPGDKIIEATLLNNKCFSMYNIRFTCPNKTDPLGYPPNIDAIPTDDNFINNTPGFKEYIHAPVDVAWVECSKPEQFIKGQDKSPVPARSRILQHVLERSPTQRSLFVHGELDFRLLADATAIALQNTTWNGKQGFQRPPTNRLIVEGKDQGSIQSERGVTFVRLSNSGHMVPEDAPQAAFNLQRYLLGQLSLEQLSK